MTYVCYVREHAAIERAAEPGARQFESGRPASLVANFTADAPQSSFLRNFQLSSIITLQSARPFTLLWALTLTMTATQ